MNRERVALIFAQQSEDEKLICAVLKNIGYQIASCNSFDQMLEFYNDQPLIIFSGIDIEKKFFHFIREFKEKKDSGNLVSIFRDDSCRKEGLAVTPSQVDLRWSCFEV